MGKIKVELDGNPIFDWDGDADAVAKILKDVPERARAVGQTPEVFAQSCVAYLQNLGKATKVGQQMQMAVVIWLILTRDTGNPEHPGKVGDYVPNTDFVVDIERGKTKLEFNIQATSKFHA
jgi:hypothetical protein